MKFAFMQNPLTQIQFFAWIYNSFIISHLLEWSIVRQIKNGIRVHFDQCELSTVKFDKISKLEIAAVFAISWLSQFCTLKKIRNGLREYSKILQLAFLMRN